MKTSPLVMASAFSGILLCSAAASADETYLTPRIDGLEIDICVFSERFPDRCGQAAQQEAALQFCRHKKHRGLKQYQTRDHGVGDLRDNLAYKEFWQDGVWRTGFFSHKGYLRFTAIECSG
ncbi:hypothetical protein [Sorangium sp. So ce1151]|uniref:hypothetical protein n=1 Tax=Sorangium sp. So ce1151 TaxID=3133332 RepID=UPI003F5E15CA